MQFFSNKIVNPAGNNGLTWDEYVQKVLTASEAKPECDDDPRGACRGQVINNDNEPEAHSYQEGESVDGKDDQAEGGSKKEAHCGKEMGECDNAGKVTEDHTDAGNAEEGNAAVEQNINNDPCYQKGESTKSEKSTKSTKSDEEDKKESDDGEKKESARKGVTKSANKSGFKKVASMNHKERLELFAAMSSKQGKNGAAAWPMAYCEAMCGITFANLKDDEKTWFKKFWLTMYPDSYVGDMVADR